jgi:AcrR family transcriptional regulator
MWRVRVLEAMAEVVVERGLRGASVAAVTRRASVSRVVFTELFDTLDDCFLALLDWILGRATALIGEAFERESCWSDGVLAGLEALLVFLDSEPAAARACLLESMAVTPIPLALRAHMLGRLGEFVDRAREHLSVERQPPAAMSEATVASVLGILRRRLLSGEAPPFVGLLGQLAEVIVAPYLGPTAAAEAASGGHDRARMLLRERSARPTACSVEVPNMLCHASAHRMRSCLRYLAESPGASNQAVAASIGILHPGQTSVLLARLHDAGLLVKKRGGAGRPNAWRLSPYGGEVTRTLDGR